ncbi:hypothetical protein [Pseudotabrizicola algicola]|uniref:Uncharacterized protein n=1 Tax=Pseudotabrizicola algicola TaxID=2709381 RepID=A0A6B3RHJ4_9RHOB|nr:hypothetical protein [Pseudotabrizicola algicola]NEX44716.1 hypothetical protein [Pseudotabrizicola algicola]
MQAAARRDLRGVVESVAGPQSGGECVRGVGAEQMWNGAIGRSGLGLLGFRLGGAVFAALALLAVAAEAEPVKLRVTAAASEDGTAAGPVSWSAVPLDLPEDADVFDAMVMTQEPVEGAWEVLLEPGRYLLSGFTEAELYEAEVEVSARMAEVVVPVLVIEGGVALRCAEAECAYSDPQTGLVATVPQGWAVEVPYFADLGDGTLASEISTVFFEDLEGDGGAVWFLNPLDWIDGDTGPCRAVALGSLCTFELSEAAEAGFAVIAPSLQRVAP